MNYEELQPQIHFVLAMIATLTFATIHDCASVFCISNMHTYVYCRVWTCIKYLVVA